MRATNRRAGSTVLAVAGVVLWSPVVRAAPVPDRVWGTYVGGVEDETDGSVAVAGDGSVYLCGASATTSGFTTAGIHQEAFGGGSSA